MKKRIKDKNSTLLNNTITQSISTIVYKIKKIFFKLKYIKKIKNKRHIY
jgi:hypothetical protein